jgi:hypothetical protein
LSAALNRPNAAVDPATESCPVPVPPPRRAAAKTSSKKTRKSSSPDRPGRKTPRPAARDDRARPPRKEPPAAPQSGPARPAEADDRGARGEAAKEDVEAKSDQRGKARVGTRSSATDTANTAPARRGRAQTPDAARALAELAGRINQMHGQGEALRLRVRQDGLEWIERARQIGEALAEAKALAGHGHWLRWVEDNLDIEQRMTRYYIGVHKHWDQIEPRLGGDRHPGADFSLKGLVQSTPRPRRPAALPAPIDRHEGGPDAAGEGTALGEVILDDAEPGDPGCGPAPGPAEPATTRFEDPPTRLGLSEVRPDRRAAGSEGPGRANDDEGRSASVAETSRADPPGAPALDDVFEDPPLEWPGVDDPDDGDVLDDLRMFIWGTMRVAHRIHLEIRDDWRVRAAWAATGTLRRRAADLLTAFSPRALANCPRCKGHGITSGRRCDCCEGTGSVLSD